MSDMRQMTSMGRNIESTSFSIVDQEAGEHDHPPDAWQIVRRVIHATADFEFKSLMHFQHEAVQAGIDALRAGCPIVVDVKMIEAGLSPERLGVYGCKIHHFISDEDVIATAKEKNSTRAIESMQKAYRLGLLDNAIIAVGNAPTALLEVVSMIEQKLISPALIIGVPVGFVSAVESKEAVLNTSCPAILSRGRKGGSTIAVSIIHALLMLSKKDQA